MIINHNISAIFANRILKHTEHGMDKNIEKLSSGMRINRAGDDASGLSVSEKMRSQIRGLRMAERNAQDGISLIQTTEGYLGETTAVLQRIRELSIQASNGIYTTADRMQIQVEVHQLVDEVDRIASQSEFNTIRLLTGRFSEGLQGEPVAASMFLHVGANMDQRIRMYIGTMTATALGLTAAGGGSAVSLSTPANANRLIGTIDSALSKVNKQRADLGAYQNRLEHLSEGLRIAHENTQAAESRIRDTDMAAEVSEFVKNNVLLQAGVAMLTQANMKSQAVLNLLT